MNKQEQDRRVVFLGLLSLYHKLDVSLDEFEKLIAEELRHNREKEGYNASNSHDAGEGEDQVTTTA